MNKNLLVISGVVLGVILGVGGMVWSGDKQKAQSEKSAKQAVAIAMSAKITIDQAIKTASENFAGQVIEADLKKIQDRAVWEVEVLTTDQGIMAVQIDAQSGSVILTEERGVRG
jgi:uncharacterized membrane protein YkoI